VDVYIYIFWYDADFYWFPHKKKEKEKSQSIGKTNNSEVFGSKKSTWSQLNNQNQLRYS
jgi:hypothetical protein